LKSLLIEDGVSAHLAFCSPSGRVGEPIPVQFTIASHAHRGSAPIVVSEVLVDFEGGFRNLRVSHSAAANTGPTASAANVQMHELALEEQAVDNETASLERSTLKTHFLSGSANLEIPPGISKVLAFALLPREAGEARAAKATLCIREELFDLDVEIPLEDRKSHSYWGISGNTQLTRTKASLEQGPSVKILPKPPKLRIEAPGLRNAYYTDEEIRVEVEMVNGEDETVNVRLSAQLIGSKDQVPILRWKADQADEEADQPTFQQGPSSQVQELAARPLPPAGRTCRIIGFTAVSQMAEYSLELKADYHLATDPDTPVSSHLAKDLVFIRPFEATYEFLPRIHPDPWPSYFHAGGEEDASGDPDRGLSGNGLKQQWLLRAKIASFGVEDLTIHGVHLRLSDAKFGTRCRISTTDDDTDRGREIVVRPQDTVPRSFGLEVQKISLEDRRASALFLHLEILWRRAGAAAARPMTTILHAPELTIPFGEPRVLASAGPPPERLRPLQLVYMLENPSMHLLTFSLVMEPSEEFAFSGPKSVKVQLVPLSRHSVRFNLLPIKREGWIAPVLRVVDVGFGKTLKTLAAEGCRADEKGIAIWVG
jgi:trafficking protein particle complex subunit 11